MPSLEVAMEFFTQYGFLTGILILLVFYFIVSIIWMTKKNSDNISKLLEEIRNLASLLIKISYQINFALKATSYYKEGNKMKGDLASEVARDVGDEIKEMEGDL